MAGIIAGFLGGISAILFIKLIHLAQSLREIHPALIFSLPFSGMMIRSLYARYGNSALEAPTLTLSVFLSHLGGASVGREGAIIHLSRILSNDVGKFLNFEERKIKKMMVAAIGAGFGAALGAPFAGLIFGFEENKHPFLRPATLIHSAIAVTIAQAMVYYSGTVHFRIPAFEVPDYQFTRFAFVLVLGVLFGLIAALYHVARRTYESFFMNTHPLVAGFIGGGILFSIYCNFNFNEFQGLGESAIIEASQQMASATMTWKKMLVTVISLGSGFQGGEYFPLAFLGASMGSAFGLVSPALIPLFAGMGIVAVYGAATQTPIACTILAAELFGWKALPFAILAAGMASLVHSRIISKSDLDS